jgi:hypothetical protein
MTFSDVAGNPQGSGVGALLLLAAAINAKRHGAVAVLVQLAMNEALWDRYCDGEQLSDWIIEGYVAGSYLFDIDKFIDYTSHHARSKGWAYGASNTQPVVVNHVAPAVQPRVGRSLSASW